MTATGAIDPAEVGVTDAHNHAWIARVPGAIPSAPVLDNQAAIVDELRAYRHAGGGTIIDCQPGGCGRDGRVLRRLSAASGVHIVACTGFHLRKYYPAGYGLFAASVDDACRYFITELVEELEETRGKEEPVRAGFIKIACEATLESSPEHLIEAAVMASCETGAAIEVHTERGADAVRIAEAMVGFGLAPDSLILCHMDKRADFELHHTLAQEGFLLEYDTFYRPKYNPDQNVWPLLARMAAAGLDSHVAIATDIAEPHLWPVPDNGPGLTGLITRIVPRLESMGLSDQTIRRLTGYNITNRLARTC